MLGYFEERLYVLEILLADLLALVGFEIKLIKTLVEELVGGDDGLLEVGELFRKLELFEVGEGARGRGGGPDKRGGFEELHVGEV